MTEPESREVALLLQELYELAGSKPASCSFDLRKIDALHWRLAAHPALASSKGSRFDKLRGLLVAWINLDQHETGNPVVEDLRAQVLQEIVAIYEAVRTPEGSSGESVVIGLYKNSNHET